jgi:tellurium resistance protein TerD
MALNLNKGGKFNIAKEAPRLKIAGIGLGWDPNEAPGGPNFDLDVSAFLVDSTGKVPNDNGAPREDFVVFYGSDFKKNTPQGIRPFSFNEAVLGAVDAIDGTESDGDDDEDMRIYFDKVWEGITEIVITVSITKYPNDTLKDRRTLNLNFGMVNDCYIRVWDDETQTELFRYDLREQFSNEDALEFGRFVRVGDSWEFNAVGQGHVGSLGRLIELFT